MKGLLVFTLVLFSVGCISSSNNIHSLNERYPDRNIAQTSSRIHRQAVYAKALLLAVTNDLDTLTPSNIDTFCPDYSSLSSEKKNEFWASFITILAGYESNLNYNARYSQQDPSEIYMGLTQLNRASADTYCASGIDLYDVDINLECSVKIMQSSFQGPAEITSIIDNERRMVVTWPLLDAKDSQSPHHRLYQNIVRENRGFCDSLK